MRAPRRVPAASDLHAADLESWPAAWTIGENPFLSRSVFLHFSRIDPLTRADRGPANGDRRLRIWSAGCASGEEPYRSPSCCTGSCRLKDWSITILGTDLNPKVLARPRAGTYSEWSFPRHAGLVKPRYFTALSSNRYELQAWLKAWSRFACLNLVEDVLSLRH